MTMFKNKLNITIYERINVLISYIWSKFMFLMVMHPNDKETILLGENYELFS